MTDRRHYVHLDQTIPTTVHQQIQGRTVNVTLGFLPVLVLFSAYLVAFDDLHPTFAENNICKQV